MYMVAGEINKTTMVVLQKGINGSTVEDSVISKKRVNDAEAT